MYSVSKWIAARYPKTSHFKDRIKGMYFVWLNDGVWIPWQCGLISFLPFEIIHLVTMQQVTGPLKIPLGTIFCVSVKVPELKLGQKRYSRTGRRLCNILYECNSIMFIGLLFT